MIKRISPQEAHTLMTEHHYRYLDVRTEAEYAAGHPPAALNIPVMLSGPSGMQPNPAFVQVATQHLPKDAKLVVGCRGGVRSLRAVEMLLGAGYTDVIDQRAGFEGARDAFGATLEAGWAPSGLPTETQSPGCSYAELLAKK